MEGQNAAPIPTDQQPPQGKFLSLGRYEEAAGGWPRRERLGPTPSSARRG